MLWLLQISPSWSSSLLNALLKNGPMAEIMDLSILESLYFVILINELAIFKNNS